MKYKITCKLCIQAKLGIQSQNFFQVLKELKKIRNLIKMACAPEDPNYISELGCIVHDYWYITSVSKD